jgi:hypothetical protein
VNANTQPRDGLLGVSWHSLKEERRHVWHRELMVLKYGAAGVSIVVCDGDFDGDVARGTASVAERTGWEGL